MKKTKKIRRACLLLGAVLAVATNLFSTCEKDVAVSSVTVEPTTLSLFVGSTYKLMETVSPHDATTKAVVWTSNKDAVAKVNSSTGVVTAVAAGAATITVTTQNGAKTATCAVTVYNAGDNVAVTGVSVEPTTLSLNVGSSQTLTATVLPSLATNKTVTWSSSNASIASVNNGTVTAVAAGTATITVTTADGNKTATCVVTVTTAGTTVAVTSVSLSPATLSLPVGSKQTLTATVLPESATNKTVTWSSSSTATATVNAGTVTAVATGAATITVTTVDGNKTATCAVTVIPAVLIEGLVVTNSTINLNAIGATATITLYIMPESATNKTMIYATETPGVATIGANGTVTAIGAGSTKFTVTTTDGSNLSDFGYIYVTL